MKLSKVLKIRVEPQLLADLEEVASSEDRPVANMIRRVLLEHVRGYFGKKKSVAEIELATETQLHHVTATKGTPRG